MRHAVVPAAQELTAAAALFTVLWGCGAPFAIRDRPRYRRPSGPPSTIDLTGTWDGAIRSSPDPNRSARLVISGARGIPIPTLTVGDTTYEASRSPVSFQTASDFVLYVRRGTTLVALTGQISPDRRRLGGAIAGLALHARLFTFERR